MSVNAFGRLTWFVAMFVAQVVRADSPPSAPSLEQIYSNNGRFSVVFDPVNNHVSVYRNGTRRPQKLWSMRADVPTLCVSDDGRYLVIYYRNANLLALDHAHDEIMLSFYDRGRLLSVVRLPQLIGEADLVRTDSHFMWAYSYGFDGAHNFAVETADHRVHVFDATTGLPVIRRGTRNH
ncbi:MAG: hypothetical protein RL701_1498 [Pseudomonadota bacterium]|jgi:hypothetical protein